MIKSLLLKNWKSFESAQLWVDQLTFIIGTNAAGKSNIVDALSFLANTATGCRLSDSVSLIRGGVEGLIKRDEDSATLNIVLIVGKEEFNYGISLELEGKELLIKEEKLVVTNHAGREKILYSTDEAEEGSNQIVARFQKDKAGPRKGLPVKRDFSVLSQIPNLNVIKDIKEKAELVSNSLKSIFVLDPKPEKMRHYTPLADKLASDGSNIAGVIAGLPDDKKKEFEKKLTDYVRPLPERDLKKIWAEPIGRFSYAKLEIFSICTTFMPYKFILLLTLFSIFVFPGH